MSKPWINEPSPVTDDNFDHVANWHSEWACRRIDKKDEELVPARVCRDLERRFRHAERLLGKLVEAIDAANCPPIGPLGWIAIEDANAHLAAAKESDNE
jgi:hypothetical protein